MNLKNFLIYLLSLLLIISLTDICLADSQPIIKEIVVTGPERTHKEIIYSHLPFDRGDKWQDDYLKLTKSRIVALGIFDPVELTVLTEPITDNKIRVVIRATDTGIFYVDPVEFAIMKTVDFNYNRFRQNFRSPSGKGMKYKINYGWGFAPWWSLGIDFPGKNGFTGGWQHYNYQRKRLFNDIQYNEQGYRKSIMLTHILSSQTRLNYLFNYLNNYFEISEQEPVKQQYLDFDIGLVRNSYGQLGVNYCYGKSLNSDQPDYFKFIVDYLIQKDIHPGSLVYRLQGGIGSAETPLNLQFKGGGFSEIALRGYNFNQAGDRFLRTTVEFHSSIINNFNLILFSDGGKIIPVGYRFNEEKWLLSAGIGISYKTPVAVPVRLDVVTNQQGAINWNIGFGHNF